MKQTREIQSELENTIIKINELNGRASILKTNHINLEESFIQGKADLSELTGNQLSINTLASTIEILNTKKVRLETQLAEAKTSDVKNAALWRAKEINEELAFLYRQYNEIYWNMDKFVRESMENIIKIKVSISQHKIEFGKAMREHSPGIKTKSDHLTYEENLLAQSFLNELSAMGATKDFGNTRIDLSGSDTAEAYAIIERLLLHKMEREARAVRKA